MRTQTLFLVGSLVASGLLFDAPGQAETASRAAPKRAAQKLKKSAQVVPPATEEPPSKAPEPSEERCAINVKVENLRKNGDSFKGQLCYTLFSGKEGFPDKSDLAVINECIKVEQAPILSFKIDNQPCNHDYAIALLHDENLNRQLDKNIAIPKEGVGMSNNPSFIRVNSPPYDDVKFMVQAPSAQQTIRMHYWP